MKKFLAGILLAAMLLSACAGEKAPDQTKEPGATEEKQEEKTEGAKGLVTDYDYFSQMSEEEKYAIFGKGSMKNAHLPKVNLDFPYAHYINYFILKNIIPGLQVYTPSIYGEDMGEWDSEKSLAPGDTPALDEEAVIAAVSDASVIVADPLYRPVVPDVVHFVPLPHLALSGRIFLAQMQIGRAHV